MNTKEITLDKLGLTLEELQYTNPDGSYSVKCEHLEGPIFHATSAGYLGGKASKGHVAVVEKIFTAYQQAGYSGKIYFIDDVSERTGVTPGARKFIMEKLKKWPKLGALVGVGSNYVTRVLISIYGKMNPDIHFYAAKSKEEALKFVRSLNIEEVT